MTSCPVRSVLALFAAAALVLASAPRPARAEDVFALSPIYSLRPDGTAQELSLGDLGALKARNVHWDGGARRVTLRGARNEEVCVQLVVAAAGRGFSAAVEGLDEVPRHHVSFSVLGYVRTSAGRLVPDLVVPLDSSGGGLTSFDVPLAAPGLPEPGNRFGLVLLEIWIPRDARAGVHAGGIVILSEGKPATRMALELEVFDFALPDMPSYRLELLSYGSPLEAFGIDSVLAASGADLETSPEAIQLEEEVHRVALENRGYLNVLPYSSQRGTARYGFAVTGDGAEARVVSSAGFEKRFGRLLAGEIGKFRVPPAFFTLPFNLNYPQGRGAEPDAQLDFRRFKDTVPDGPGKEPGLLAYEEAWKAVAGAYVERFAARGWKETRFEVYFNQKPNPDRNRSPWHLDEPTSAADYRALRYLLGVARWAFAGAAPRGVRVVNRVDIGHWECERMKSPAGRRAPCYKAKDYARGGAAGLLRPVVDRWVLGVTHSEAAPELVREYARGGVFADQYGTCGSEDGALAGHAGEHAGLAWKHAFLGAGGRVFYHAGFGEDLAQPRGPVLMYAAARQADGRYFTAFKERRGALPRFAWRGALASRRMKLWRDSVNAYEYLRLAGERDPALVRSVLSRLVFVRESHDAKYRERSGSAGVWFTNNVEDVERARRALARGITGKGPAINLAGESRDYIACGAPDAITD